MEAKPNDWPGAILVATAGLAMVLGAVTRDRPSYAVALGLGAFFTGGITLAEVPGHKARSTAWALLWMTLAAVTGGLITDRGPVELLVVGLLALVVGFTACLGPRGARIGVVSLAMFAVTAGSAMLAREAIVHSALFAVGGAVAAAAAALVARRAARSETRSVPSIVLRLRAGCYPHSRYVRHAITLAIAMVVASLVGRHSGLPHHYWIPMTVAFVVIPSAHGTVRLVLLRLGGTVASVVAMLMIAWILPLDEVGLAVLYALVALIGLRVGVPTNWLWVFSVTSVVLALLAIAGDPITDSAGQRLIETFIAVVISAVAVGIAATLTRHGGEQAVAPGGLGEGVRP